MQWVFKVAYEFEHPSELVSVHLLFHDFMLKKCIGNPESILSIKGLCVKDNLSCEEVLVQILDRKVKNLSNNRLVSVKVLWKNHLVEDAT